MVPKHVGLLEVNKKEFRMQSIPLKSVRQLYMEDVVLSKHVRMGEPNSQKKCEAFCAEKVEALLAKAGKFVNDMKKLFKYDFTSLHTAIYPRDVNLSDFFIKSNFKGARANLKTTF